MMRAVRKERQEMTRKMMVKNSISKVWQKGAYDEGGEEVGRDRR
jgi:hypothetical protein